MKVWNSPSRLFILSISVLLLAAALRLWQIARIPPGLYIDEAYDLSRAQEVARGQSFPVYITGNNCEPLVIYLTAAFTLILGPVDWAGRLAVALAGLIGVAATLRAGNELFPRRPVGVLAGLCLATLFASLTVGRMGIQPMLAMPAAAGALAAFWHGIRTARRRAFLVAGICLGLGLDAYVAFRLFPLVLLALGVALWLWRCQQRRALAVGLLLTLLAAGVVFAPLAWFFIQNPHWFFNRFEQTASPTLSAGNLALALANNFFKTIGGLFWAGDVNWRHNLPGRPMLDAAQMLFFLTGLGVCLRHWRRPESWALFIWLAVGLSPSVLTIEAPHFGRVTMATPALALLAGLGITALWNVTRSPLARGLVITALALSGLLTTRDYFARWAQAPELFEAFSGEQVQLAQALQAVSPGATFYTTPIRLSDVPSYNYVYWTLEYGLERAKFKRAATFDGNACSVLPARSSSEVLFAVLASDQRTASALKAAYPVVFQIGSIPNLDVYRVPAGQTARLSLANSRSTDFGDLIRLRGYSVSPAALTPGKSLSLTVAWEARAAVAAPYKVFVHLTGAPKPDGSTVYAQQDTLPCAGTYATWQPNELVLETYQLSIPQDLPPGDFTLSIGWYAEASGERLPMVDDNGQPAGDSLVLEIFQNRPR